MKQLINLSCIALAITVSHSVFAGAGEDCHFHGNKPAAKETVLKCADQRVGKLIELVTADYFGQVLVTDTDPRRMLELFKSLPIEKKLFQLENGEIEVIID